MASSLQLQDRPRVLVVGGGYVGLYVALKLQKKIASAGGIVTLVDPLPYMTYQPFLPEVAGGKHDVEVGNLEGAATVGGCDHCRAVGVVD